MLRAGKLFEYISPVEIHLNAKKIGDKWVFEYVEIFEKPDNMSEDEFRKTVQNTVKLLKIVGLNCKNEGNKISFRGEGTLDHVASAIVSEFIGISSMGDITLRDLIFGFGLSATILKKFKETRKQVEEVYKKTFGDKYEVEGST